MKPQPAFGPRSLRGGLAPLQGVRFEVSRLIWSVIGGPDQCEIEAYGGELALRGLPSLLRCPVEIWQYGWIWWGYVHTVVLHLRGAEVTLSLEEMSNRVAVAYQWTGAGARSSGGLRKTTPWVQDNESVATFGKKERLISGQNMSDAAAIAQRDANLDLYKKPVGGPPNSGIAMGSGISATLYCRGWWDTTSWQLANVPTVLLTSYETTSTTTQAVGSAKTNAKVMQQFKTGAAAAHPLQVSLYVKKVGAPTDNLNMALYALDSNGIPVGSPIASGSLHYSLFTTNLTWLTATFIEQLLAANTTYAVQINRSGKVDEANYYAVGVNEAKGYADGFFRIHNGTKWVARSPDADLVFKILENQQVETTTQITSLLTSSAEFITGSNILTASSITQGSYQDGDTTVRSVLENLLKSGVAGSRRLLATVTRERRVLLYQEPLKPARPHYRVDSTGRIFVDGRKINWIDSLMIGQWVVAAGTPVAAGSSTLTSVDMQFVETLEWTPEQGMQPRYKGLPAPEDLLRRLK